MAVYKCKMCGGDLNLIEGQTVCECEYCGTQQTVPTADNEKKMTLFGRAGRLLRACEFDKAAGVFESIVADFPEEAEAYWGLALCKYGIEYVDDPATAKKVPTCHRSSFDSIMEDDNFEQAVENADPVARKVYREEAKTIEELRKGIIEVSGKEEPYDIFICYKETDENGDRTLDSVLAQDIYDALTEKGYRVFFSRITLEDKLGQEYEPYIFAALNSAKIMLAVGTDYEYYNAVWVKNEWSRFLQRIARGEKKTLIPCYKNLDAYDMPKEFAHLQAQDIGKVGAMQDLVRGIEKIIPHKEDYSPQVAQSSKPNVTALLQRGNLTLEDGEWDKAKGFFDQVLNIDAQCAAAYLGLTLAEYKLRNTEEIMGLMRRQEFSQVEQNQNYQKFLRFAAEDEKAQIDRLWETTIQEQQESKARCTLARQRIAPAQGLIAAGNVDTVGVVSDGTVVAVGGNYDGQCDVSDWRDIVAIAVGGFHTVGLRRDGTVVAVCSDDYGQCDVADWKDIAAVAAGIFHTVGLRKNGTVVALGENRSGECNVASWTDIGAVAAGSNHTVGLKSDGTVLATGDNESDQCNVAEWTDIVAVSAGHRYTVGLKSDGTVMAVGNNEYGECNVSGWTDIVSVSATNSHTVGLKEDGSVVATGYNESGECNISDWTDIVAVSAGSHTVGLKSDGTVLATGDNGLGQCNVSGWKLFDCLDTLELERKEATERAERERKESEECAEKERIEAAERAEKERIEAEARAEKARKEAEERAEKERQQRLAALTTQKESLQSELANLKGLFSGKRRKEIEARLARIEAELKYNGGAG